jgi:hypothetical protein
MIARAVHAQAHGRGQLESGRRSAAGRGRRDVVLVRRRNDLEHFVVGQPLGEHSEEFGHLLVVRRGELGEGLDGRVHCQGNERVLGTWDVQQISCVVHHHQSVARLEPVGQGLVDHRHTVAAEGHQLTGLQTGEGRAGTKLGSGRGAHET